MAHAVVHKLGTDWRFRLAFLLLGVAISVPVGLVTEKLGAAAIVVAAFSMVVGLCKYRYERSPSH